MKNLKKIKREHLKSIQGGLIKMLDCIRIYGCPPETRECYWRNPGGGGGDVYCV